MKVALLYPGITETGFAKDGFRPKTGWMHHGLCSISASLKSKGHKVSLIDLRQLSGWDKLPGLITSLMPEVVGITMMSLDFDYALESARIIKKTNPMIKIIVGGAHPTIMESELINNSDIDYIFKGEAEVTLPEILDEVRKGSLKTKVIQGEAPDLEKIAFIDRHLFKTLEAPLVPFLKMPFITAIAGRGCTYNCSFCQPAEKIMFGPKVRRVSVERFIDELLIAKREIGLNSLMVHDDCLLEDTAWVEKFLRIYRKNFNKPFICQSRADIIVRSPGLFRDMKRSGLAMLLIGFESGSQRMLNFLRKGTTVEQNYKAAAICKKLGVRVWANFMMGMPTETNEEVTDTIRMIKRIKPYMPSPSFYTPHPGSDLYNFCAENDLSLIKKHEDYRRDPTGAKIKGVDYEFLRKSLAKAAAVPRSVKLRRKIDRLKLGHFNKELIKNYEV